MYLVQKSAEDFENWNIYEEDKVTGIKNCLKQSYLKLLFAHYIMYKQALL